MVHILVTSNKYLHLYGALFVFQRVGSVCKHTRIQSCFKPRRVPRERPHGSFSSSESVIVGKTLPAEVSVTPASIMKQTTAKTKIDHTDVKLRRVSCQLSYAVYQQALDFVSQNPPRGLLAPNTPSFQFC